MMSKNMPTPPHGRIKSKWLATQLRVIQTLRSRRPSTTPEHLATGERGEREALFHLRSLGYTIVATRWKSAKLWGDIDLIGWEGPTLCFIEVKSRTRRDISPAEAAVDRDKRDMLQKMAKAYLRSFPEPLREKIPVRFDVVSVYLPASGAEFELHRAAFGWS